MKRILTAAALITATLFWMVHPAAQAANGVCDEPNGQSITANTPGSVTVPVNGVCHINGFAIGGSITVAQGGKLFLRNGSTVGGSVSANSPQQLNLLNGTTIAGSLRVSGPGGGFGGFACGVRIGGSVYLQNLTSGSWIIGEPTVAYGDDPTPVYGGPDPDLNCQSPNDIGGSVFFLNNAVARLKLKANSIGTGPGGGSVFISGNSVVNEIIRVEGNTIKNSISCSGNTWTFGPPAITSGSVANTIGGAKTGQCSAF